MFSIVYNHLKVKKKFLLPQNEVLYPQVFFDGVCHVEQPFSTVAQYGQIIMLFELPVSD